MEQLARPLALVAVGGLERLQPQSLPSPIRVKIPETVESGIASVSAISAPVIRNRRNAAIAATRSSPVRDRHRLGRRGAIEQTLLALDAETTQPLRDRAHAHAGGLGRRRERPPLLLDPVNHQRDGCADRSSR